MRQTKKEKSFDTYSQIRITDMNLSAQNTTAGASTKFAATTNQKSAKMKTLATWANVTQQGSKNFQGIEEIPDENSARVHNDQAENSSQGRWSSDIQDETLTMTHSARGGGEMPNFVI